MVRTPLGRSLATLGVAMAILGGASATHAQLYTLQTISPPAGTYSCTAVNINNLGEAVGRTTVQVSRRSYSRGPAFIWKNGQSKVLPPLSGQSEAEATAVSDTGMAVGGLSIFAAVEASRATWWESAPSGYQPHDWNDLVPIDWNITMLRASSMSHDGRYVGFQADLGGIGQRDIIAEIELDATSRIPQAILKYWDVCDVWGVTDIHYDGAGLVLASGLGGSDVANPGAFLWIKSPDGSTNLLDHHSSADSNTGAWGVNALGELAGFRRNSAVDRAVYWDANGFMSDIGTLGGTESEAYSINDAGYVVGWANALSKGKTQGVHAFLWRADTGMRDLNALKSPTDTSGLVLTSGRRINNGGQILAWSGSVSVLLKPE